MRLEITRKNLVEYGTVGLVLVSGSLAGHFAAVGMNLVQFAGAVTAVLGSVTVAVAVRVWPAKTDAAKAD